MKYFRLWNGPDDYGKAGERPARLWLQAALERGDDARLEEISDDAPTFLKDRHQPEPNPGPPLKTT